MPCDLQAPEKGDVGGAAVVAAGPESSSEGEGQSSEDDDEGANRDGSDKDDAVRDVSFEMMHKYVPATNGFTNLFQVIIVPLITEVTNKPQINPAINTDLIGDLNIFSQTCTKDFGNCAE